MNTFIFTALSMLAAGSDGTLCSKDDGRFPKVGEPIESCDDEISFKILSIDEVGTNEARALVLRMQHEDVDEFVRFQHRHANETLLVLVDGKFASFVYVVKPQRRQFRFPVIDDVQRDQLLAAFGKVRARKN